MKACFQIAECSLSYAKIMQASAMKTCFQIAECRLSYAKIMQRYAHYPQELIPGFRKILPFFIQSDHPSISSFT